MNFEIIGPIENAETFATGRQIRELKRLRRVYGAARWRKRKGIARVKLADGGIRRFELHEGSGFGRVEFKIKHYLD
ncbi:MAG: hypothetical protein A4S17_05610 [Proteobacteria bacterium HN_bin10]|nr:MAG: hypothetical protein A4S17_05610 [Proteobacteria bacterium HN_bin10]